jgi:hypothetical protein
MWWRGKGGRPMWPPVGVVGPLGTGCGAGGPMWRRGRVGRPTWRSSPRGKFKFKHKHEFEFEQYLE